MARSMSLIFSLVPSKNSPVRETEAKKSLAIMQNANSWMIEFNQNTEFAKKILYFIIQELKFCKIAQLVFVLVSLVRGFFEETGPR